MCIFLFCSQPFALLLRKHLITTENSLKFLVGFQQLTSRAALKPPLPKRAATRHHCAAYTLLGGGLPSTTFGPTCRNPAWLQPSTHSHGGALTNTPQQNTTRKQIPLLYILNFNIYNKQLKLPMDIFFNQQEEQEEQLSSKESTVVN